MSGVNPSVSCSSGSAPLASRCRTHAAAPSITAAASGVSPLSCAARLTSAPASRSTAVAWA
eukprot:scaffold11454_cov15-Phaeocystis_antarctica.AAC.1